MAAAGVKLINLDDGETLVSLERVAEEPEDAADVAVEEANNGETNTSGNVAADSDDADNETNG